MIPLDLPESCWCSRCTEFFNHSLAQHNSSLLELIGGLFTKQIMYRCKKDAGHIFYTSSIRKHAFQKQYRIHDYACPDCKKQQKEKQKQAAAKEVERQRKIIEEKQKKLFENFNHEEFKKNNQQRPSMNPEWGAYPGKGSWTQL